MPEDFLATLNARVVFRPLTISIPAPQHAPDRRAFVPFTDLVTAAVMAAVKLGKHRQLEAQFALLQPEATGVPTPLINLELARTTLERILGIPVAFVAYDDALAQEVAA